MVRILNAHPLIARVAVILCLISLTPTAWAYPTPMDFTGKLARWDIDSTSDSITYVIKADNANNLDRYGPLIRQSAGMWTEIQGSYLKLSEVSSEVTAAVTINLDDQLRDGAYSSGYSIVDEYNDDGTPRYCSIYIAMNNNPTYVSLAKTILHELGHCIGLGHSLIPQAVMSYSLDENSFALDTDDIAAVSRLYPILGDEPGVPLGCSVTASKTGQKMWPQLWLLVLPLMLVFCFYFLRDQLHALSKAPAKAYSRINRRSAQQPHRRL